MNPMIHASGGSEWRTIELFKRLADRADVTIWSGEQPDPALIGIVPMRCLRPRVKAVPRSGTIVVVGTYLNLDPWIEACRADRIILIHNFDAPDRLERSLRRLKELCYRNIDVVYASKLLRERAKGPPGEVHVSPIDLNRFRPRPRPERPFTIGRMSRDDVSKHHPHDPTLYRELADRGIQVRIMGGEILREAIGSHERIEIIPAGAERAEDFLASLDVFVYRTHPDWFEPSARVISEAMASGVPIVAERRHGYIDYFGGGILFQDPAQMKGAIDCLRLDSDLYESLAQEGRRKAECWFGDEAVERVLEFYLR